MDLSRREFLAASAATPLAGFDRAPRSTLLILADQLTWWMVDPAQRGILDLPNIDRLFAEGTVFDHCYSSSPVCAAARVALRTGLFPHANPGGDALLSDTPTVEQRLQSNVARTRYIGKWHLSPREGTGSGYVLPANRPHWDSFIGHEVSHAQLETFIGNDPTPISTLPWDARTLTDFALQQIDQDASAGRAFFMQLNYLAPHHPYKKYPNSLNVYQPLQMKLRANVPPSIGFTALERQAHYMNQVRGLDIEIGRLLAKFDALGLDPVIVFTSDHGDMLFSHGEEYKRRPWEESVRVPLVVRGPGWRPKRVPHPVGIVDLPMTLARLGQGIDIRVPRDSAYMEILEPGNAWLNSTWRAVVTDDRWKLALNDQGVRLFYDLGSDPFELTNLTGQGLAREDELYARMREWAHETEDAFFG
jgi:arylsulfatase A-like enzyme